MFGSIVVSFSMLFWALVLLSILWWIVSLVMLQGLTVVRYQHDLDDERKQLIEDMFGTIPAAMYTMFAISTYGDNWLNTYRLACQAGTLYAAVMLGYSAFFTISLYNILTALLSSMWLQTRRSMIANAS